jgi:tRNA pseudouridine55 synthase
MSARQHKGSVVNGLLLLDKPLGLTSNAALQQVKRIFNARKAGHTGSLDPLATGMLPLCFGEATKFTQFLLDADKSYETTATLGVITDSGDAEGQVIERREVVEISSEKLSAILEKFRGAQLQVPSMFSAIKQKGRPLYELARQGISVVREPRAITIYNLAMTHFSGDELSLSVRCSKGTYIRSLVEDIGLALGCGAHVSALRRTEVAHFSQDTMVSLEHLRALFEKNNVDELHQFLLPIDALLDALPEVHLNEQAALSLMKGQAVTVESAGLGQKSGEHRLYDHEGRFIGVGVLEDDALRAKRLINTVLI